MTRLSMGAMAVMVMAMIPLMSTEPSGQDGLATLTISDTVIQMATCDSADSTRRTQMIDMQLVDSSGSKISHLATAKGRDPTPDRNSQYTKTLAAEVAIKDGDNPRLTIMLAKSDHLNLEHDRVGCFYNYDGVLAEHSKMATILPSYPAKRLDWKIPVKGALKAAEDVSVEIEVKANGKFFVFNSARQPKQSVEVYPQPAKKEEAAGPPLLFMWRRPTSNSQESDVFLLTVLAASDSPLAIDSLSYSCRLKVGDDYIQCNSAVQATCEADFWKRMTIGVGAGVGGLVIIVILVALLVCLFRRRRRRGDDVETALEDKKNSKDDEDSEGEALVRQGNESGTNDMDVQGRAETLGVQVSEDNDPADIHEARV